MIFSGFLRLASPDPSDLQDRAHTSPRGILPFRTPGHSGGFTIGFGCPFQVGRYPVRMRAVGISVTRRKLRQRMSSILRLRGRIARVIRRERTLLVVRRRGATAVLLAGHTGTHRRPLVPLYTFNRILAIHAETGAERWSFSPDIDLESFNAALPRPDPMD